MFDADGDEEMACVSGIIPGVTGSTGLETAELIRKAAEIAGPDVIIAIDSLAARNLERISSTIQISDTGISPGAGTGNMRTALNEETLGIRVVAIGVPTVIDAKTLIVDSLEGYLPDMTGAERYVDGRGIRDDRHLNGNRSGYRGLFRHHCGRNQQNSSSGTELLTLHSYSR